MYLQNICRTCLGTENLMSVFEGDTGEKLMCITKLKIEPNDMLPERICLTCYNLVKNFFAFRQMCERNDQELRGSLLSKLNIKPKIEDHTVLSNSSNPSQDQRTNETIASKEYDSPSSSASVVSEPRRAETKSCKITQCNVCGKVVSSEFSLVCHMRVHTGEKPFKCQYCGKTFALSYNLKVHERIHTGHKPLHCTICDKQFAQSTSLIIHMRSHTGEKPYNCIMCNTSYKTYSNLQYHIAALHTGEKKFVCDVCERGFITKGELKQHKKTHTGERTYICTVCGLGLTRKFHLTRHMLTHSGVKNFKCNICDSSYSQKSDLKRHSFKHSVAETTQPDIQITGLKDDEM